MWDDSAQLFLIIPVPIPNEEKKLSQIFIFTLIYGAWKHFMKAFKAFIKPIEAPQRSVKSKFNLIFISIQLSEMHGTLEVNKVKFSILLIPVLNFLERESK